MTEWYHGSHNPEPIERFERRPTRHGPRDFNTELGTHFTSDHKVAREFAGREGHVHHATLDIKNPKVYEHEYDLNDEAHEWARDNGFNEIDHRPKNHPMFEGKPYLDPDNHDEGPMTGLDLREHPRKVEIADGFKAHLESQGHDGIHYGNAYEGEEGHECAIAFHPHQITVTSHHGGMAPCSTKKSVLTPMSFEEHYEQHERAAGHQGGQDGRGLGEPRGGHRGASSRGLARDAGAAQGPAGGPGGLTWHPKAAKDLKALDGPVRKQLLGTIDALQSGDPTTLSQTHPLTGPMKGWYATKASRGHRIVHRPNEDGGIHIGYVGLHEYDKAIQRLTSLAADHESYWHITDDPHFAPKADHVPEDNAIAIHERKTPGLYLTKRPETWMNNHGYVRPYLAEVHVPKGVGHPERYSGEHFVHGKDLDKVKVHRVIPIDEHSRETFKDAGYIESHHGTTLDGKPMVKKPWNAMGLDLPHDYKYTGPDVRDMSPEQHAEHHRRYVDYMVQDRGHDRADFD